MLSLFLHFLFLLLLVLADTFLHIINRLIQAVKYPNLVQSDEMAAFYASIEIEGLCHRTNTGILYTNADGVSYADEPIASMTCMSFVVTFLYSSVLIACSSIALMLRNSFTYGWGKGGAGKGIEEFKPVLQG